MLIFSYRRHHRHHSSHRSRSRSYRHRSRESSRDRYSRRSEYGSSRHTNSESSYSHSRFDTYPSGFDFDAEVFICRVDTSRYNSALSGNYGSSYNDNSFAGAHLKDIQWDMNSLIKFEKNFYHVYFPIYV